MAHTTLSSTTDETGATVSSALAARAGKYLTFSLGDESYGIAVLKVREIVKLAPITAMPQMPDHIKGVINLRGKIIPVIDLRLRFGLPPAEPTERTCIVVVQVRGSSGPLLNLGLVVDAVEEAVNIAAADIEETPDFGTVVDTTCILGMAKVKGAIKTLLDIDRALGVGDETDSADLAPAASAEPTTA